MGHKIAPLAADALRLSQHMLLLSGFDQLGEDFDGFAAVAAVDAGESYVEEETVVDQRYPIAAPLRYGTYSDGATALQRALDSAAAMGRTAQLRRLNETWEVASAVTIPSGVTIEGDGSEIVGTTDSAIVLHASATTDATIRNLKLSHTGAVRADALRVTDGVDLLLEEIHADGGQYGIRVTGDTQSRRVKLIRPRVINSVESGILLHKTLDCLIESPYSHDNGSTSLDHGIYISDATNRRVQVIAPDVGGNGGSGIQVGGRHHKIIGGTSTGNGTNGLVNSLGSEFQVIGLRCYDNTNRGVYLAGADRVRLTDVECIANGMEGLHIQQSTGVKVIGGEFSENVRDGILVDGSVLGNEVHRLTIIGSTCNDNDSADSGTYSGIRLLATAGVVAKTKIIGVTARNAGATGQIYGISVGPNVTATAIADAELFGNKTAALLDSGINTRYDKPTGESSMTFTGVAVTLTAVHDLLRYDVAGGSINQPLPAAANCSGRIYTFIKTDASANTITLDPSGAELINGAATYVLTTQYQLVQLRSTGVAWYIVSTG